MSRTNVRYGGAALVGAVAIGSLVAPAAATATSATITSATATPVADALAGLQTAQQASAATPKAAPAAAQLPRLSHLSIPTLTASAASQGFAGRDVAIDAAPDMVGRDLAFTLQRLDGETWVDAHTGTTAGDADVATAPNMPAGTYRVVVPAAFGMDEFVGEPFPHQPRQLGAGITFTPGNTRTVVDVNPDPQAGATFTFALQRKSRDGWQSAGEFSTADGNYTFNDLASGTYRVVLPDQADALGTTSNEVAVTSAADQRAAAQRAAAAARPAPARPQSSSTAGSRPVTQAGPAAPQSASGGGIVGTAMAQLGDAYRLGATGPDAFDCSGLTSYAYRAAGISIPRTAAAQYAAARKVSDPQPGDLVFFLNNGAQHVGIYIGGGRMVHAANPGRGVEVTSYNSGWYARSFTGFGRY